MSAETEELVRICEAIQPGPAYMSLCVNPPPRVSSNSARPAMKSPEILKTKRMLRLGNPNQVGTRFQALLLVVAFFCTVAALEGQPADSVYLDYQEGLSKSGDLIYTEVAVEQTSVDTFYAALVWNTGYMGLQRGGSGYNKHVHFSIWDPPAGGMTQLVWADAGVNAQRFGGEGTGWKAMLPFEWVEGIYYQLCVTLKRRDGATDYHAYFGNPTAGTWRHVATFRRPEPNLSFSYVAAFVEDFGNSGANRRSCMLGSTWLRTFSSQWVELRTAKFASGGSQMNKDADVVGSRFRLETGGGTVNDTSLNSTLVRSASIPPPKFEFLFPVLSTVLAWGYNSDGQTAVPASLNDVTSIAIGDRHSVALRSDGVVVAWGANNLAQTTLPPSSQSSVKAIAAGGNFTIALKGDGTVIAWGQNNFGQTNVPPSVQGHVAAVAAAGDHILALKNDGTVVAWGWNEYGQTTVPAGLTGVRAVAAGLYHSVALKSDGAVVAWGASGVAADNNYGQANVPLAAQSGIVAVAAGGWHTVALKADGTVIAWGQVFNGTGLAPETVPPSLAEVKAIAAGWNHTIALKRDGTVVAWGWNGAGQTSVPSNLSGVMSIAAGWNHSAATIGLAPVPSLIGGNLRLRWPETAVGYRVESTTNLVPPVAWSNETASLQTNGGSVSVVLPASGARKLYRLVRP